MNWINPLLWFLPAYVANASATFSKLVGKTHPIDFGLKYNGKRILGDGKTWEGTLIGLVLGTAVGIPTFYLFSLGPWWEVIVISLGALIGDMVGSFVKRQVGLVRGAEATLIDQLDFVFGVFLIDTPPPDYGIVILIITPILHKLANIAGHRIGVKNVPW
jgi:CDP-2,3-bis-(O-geranylgeranyl)-sn-glycerol synthase